MTEVIGIDLAQEDAKLFAMDAPTPGEGKPSSGAKSERGNKTEERHVMKEVIKTVTRLTPAELAKKQELILKITRYEKSKHFGEMLRTLNFKFGKGLNSLTIEDLEDELVQIRTACNNKTSGNWIHQGIITGVGVVEKLTQAPAIKAKVDLNGWSARLSKDEEFDEVCELLSLEYLTFSSMSPEVRLLFALTKSGMAVAGTNKFMAQAQQRIAQAEAPPSEPDPVLAPQQQPMPQRSAPASFLAPPMINLDVQIEEADAEEEEDFNCEITEVIEQEEEEVPSKTEEIFKLKKKIQLRPKV